MHAFIFWECSDWNAFPDKTTTDIRNSTFLNSMSYKIHSMVKCLTPDPYAHWIALGWTGMPICFLGFYLPNISPHQCSCGWINTSPQKRSTIYLVESFPRRLEVITEKVRLNLERDLEPLLNLERDVQKHMSLMVRCPQTFDHPVHIVIEKFFTSDCFLFELQIQKCQEGGGC